jgi:hypothetical protein
VEVRAERLGSSAPAAGRRRGGRRRRLGLVRRGLGFSRLPSGDETVMILNYCLINLEGIQVFI